MSSNLARTTPGRAGRRPAGPDGERVDAMPKVRVPRETLERIREIALEQGVPVWRVVAEAVEGLE